MLSLSLSLSLCLPCQRCEVKVVEQARRKSESRFFLCVQQPLKEHPSEAIQKKTANGSNFSLFMTMDTKMFQVCRLHVKKTTPSNRNDLPVRHMRTFQKLVQSFPGFLFQRFVQVQILLGCATSVRLGCLGGALSASACCW